MKVIQKRTARYTFLMYVYSRKRFGKTENFSAKPVLLIKISAKLAEIAVLLAL